MTMGVGTRPRKSPPAASRSVGNESSSAGSQALADIIFWRRIDQVSPKLSYFALGKETSEKAAAANARGERDA